MSAAAAPSSPAACSPPPPDAGWRERLSARLLGPPGRQRVRVAQTLLSFGVIAAYVPIQGAAVLLGLMPVADMLLFNAYNLSWAFAFYLLIRSGWNLRLSRDPALTVPQCVFALVGSAWAYGICGPTRGAMLVAMMLVLVFSFFGLRVGQARWLALLGFGLLAGVMAYKVSTDPLAYEPRVEMIHLTLAGLFLFAVAVLAGRLTRMRQRLTEQRTALQEALTRIQELATRDPLTGLLNRRAMGELLAQEAARAQRLGTPFSVVLFDLDHFKQVNDRLGHAAGDEVLRSFAQVAMGRVRKTDALARWGGEEFLLLLPDTVPACALTVVARVREGLVALPPHIGLPGGVRFSAGVAACVAPEDVQPALERADEALYQAKAAGRDRCLVAA